MEVDSPEAANRLIEIGLSEGGEIKRVERFEASCKLTQCFNCQQFGHIAKSCKNTTVCGYCIGQHSTRDCPKKERQLPTDRKCTNCCKNHETWDRSCEIRQKEIRRLREIYLNRPASYEVGPPRVAPPVAPIFGPPTAFTDPSPPSVKGPGRPLGSRNSNKRQRVSSGVLDSLWNTQGTPATSQDAPTPSQDTLIEDAPPLPSPTTSQ